MNLKLIESFVELIELGAFANNQDIAKGLRSAIKVTKEETKPRLSDEEIDEVLLACTKKDWLGNTDLNEYDFARAIEERHGIK